MVRSSQMRVKHGSAEVKMDCEYLGDTLDQLRNPMLRNKRCGRTKNNGWTPGNQEDGEMLCSKRCRDRPIPDQVDDRAQRSKNKDKEEDPKNDQVNVCNCLIKEDDNAQLKNDHRQDGWMKSWRTTNGGTRRRPYEIIKLNITYDGQQVKSC